MLIIDPEQMAKLDAAASRSFEARMLAHLTTYFPEESRRAGEEHIRGYIRAGMASAAAQGFTSEVDVARYVDIYVVLRLSADPARAQKWLPEIEASFALGRAAKLRMIFEQVMRLRDEAARISPGTRGAT